MSDHLKHNEMHKDVNVTTSDDVLGKDVIDAVGNMIGVVTQIHIDKHTKKIIGISIDSGFMKPFVFVGIDLVTNFGVDAVYISRTPSSLYLGLTVFDMYGVTLGKIVDVIFDEQNEVECIVVKYGVFGKVEIPKAYIKKIVRNAFLNLDRDGFFEYVKNLKENEVR